MVCRQADAETLKRGLEETTSRLSASMAAELQGKSEREEAETRADAEQKRAVAETRRAEEEKRRADSVRRIITQDLFKPQDNYRVGFSEASGIAATRAPPDLTSSLLPITKCRVCFANVPIVASYACPGVQHVAAIDVSADDRTEAKLVPEEWTRINSLRLPAICLPCLAAAAEDRFRTIWASGRLPCPSHAGSSTSFQRS